ncbi:hypothetical protein VTO42DRAFT_4269 [Malbranchea cinnamomea]
MFTPVSSQTQAFVPAHAAYPHLRNQAGRGAPRLEGVTLYGPHGHPLPPQHHVPENTLPPPTGLYQQPPYARPEDRGHPPPLAHPPPPLHDPSQDRRESAPRYDYPHQGPTLPPVSAATSGASYPPQPTPSPSAPQYYSSSPDRRSSYYDPATTSAPPPTSAPYQTLHPPPQPLPAASKGPTPPPVQPPPTTRSGLSVRDMLGPPADGPSARSSTDSDMLNALNRNGLKQ